MSVTLSQRYFVARGANTILNYLHIDLAVAGLALVFVLAGGLAGKLGLIDSVAGTLPDISVSTYAATPATVAEAASTPLSATMSAALDSVTQRYRVAPEALLPVFEAAQAAARERSMDPLLIVAVIAVESGFNPFAQSTMGAQGLMQIIPRYHQDKLPRNSAGGAFLDPVSNVQAGAHILQEAIRRQGGLKEGLQYYAGASDDSEQAYANKVIAEKQRLEQASRRREAASA
ncbi:MAG: lytic transglycosylase domain-containing protein [Sulfuritalea sp.]|nr:lytic transglycosylase domain-containing protein [Sulfuritalea sp.]MDP1984349.1 lytic transglycosylase domain-containing protein [Sulfuritalea sp.]